MVYTTACKQTAALGTHLVLRALPPTCGIKRSTPNGAFLSTRYDFNSSICCRSWSGVYPNPPITPIPPAFVTAAASLGPAATPIPAKRIGWLTPKRSVTGVRICSGRGEQTGATLLYKRYTNLRLEAIFLHQLRRSFQKINSLRRNQRRHRKMSNINIRYLKNIEDI